VTKRIAHIINPVKVGKNSDLYAAQPITFATMKTARDFAREKVDVQLYTAQYPEDRSFVPEGFEPTPDLDRSVMDVGSFEEKRKLPLIKDILDRLYEATEADYMIYTNVDIALMPHFYLAVDEIIDEGRDGFVINRRTITDVRKSVEEIPLMYASIGKPHPGHDCFVFRRDAYESFKLGASCVGVSLVGRVLLFNLVCHSKQFAEFNEHLTFHIGDDRAWDSGRYADYAAHNRQEALKVLKELEGEFGSLEEHEFLRPFVRDVLGKGPGIIAKTAHLLSRKK